ERTAVGASFDYLDFTILRIDGGVMLCIVEIGRTSNPFSVADHFIIDFIFSCRTPIPLDLTGVGMVRGGSGANLGAQPVHGVADTAKLGVKLCLAISVFCAFKFIIEEGRTAPRPNLSLYLIHF